MITRGVRAAAPPPRRKRQTDVAARRVAWRRIIYDRDNVAGRIMPSNGWRVSGERPPERSWTAERIPANRRA